MASLPLRTLESAVVCLLIVFMRVNSAVLQIVVSFVIARRVSFFLEHQTYY